MGFQCCGAAVSRRRAFGPKAPDHCPGVGGEVIAVGHLAAFLQHIVETARFQTDWADHDVIVRRQAQAQQWRAAMAAFPGEKSVKWINGDDDQRCDALNASSTLAPGQRSFSPSPFSGGSTVLRLACMSVAWRSI